MTLHTYENSALTEGWECSYCAAPFEHGGEHHVSPLYPGHAFCRPECAEIWITRESKKSTSNPAQVGFAL